GGAGSWRSARTACRGSTPGRSRPSSRTAASATGTSSPPASRRAPPMRSCSVTSRIPRAASRSGAGRRSPTVCSRTSARGRARRTAPKSPVQTRSWTRRGARERSGEPDVSSHPAHKGRGGAPVIEPGHTYASVTDKISSIVLARRTPLFWVLGFFLSFLLALGLLVAVSYLFAKGLGIWGINQPVEWAFDIINFVWWIGIGHAGTLISAILLLLRQEGRTSINRFAEALTLFAVACAGLFPLIHLGRPWLAYWLFPYPNTMALWPQWRSPLVWDVFAVSTYATVSFLFWFVGMIPDLATLRDRARRKGFQIFYGMLA